MNIVLNARVAQQVLNLLVSLPKEKTGKVADSSVKAIFVKNKLKNVLNDKLKDYIDASSKTLDLLNASRKATTEFIEELGCKFEPKNGATVLVNTDGSETDKEKMESVRDFLNNNNEK